MIADSDDCFILELQPRDSETEFIRVGSKHEETRQASMQEWLTAEHLDSARTSIAFRAGDSPVEEVAAAHKALGAYFETFVAPLTPNPHGNQYYWTFGVAAWRQRSARADAPLPPELDHRLPLRDLEHPTYARLRAERAPPSPGTKVRQRLFGPRLAPRGMHPGAAAHTFLQNALNEARAQATRILTVADLGAWLDRELPPGMANTYRIEPYLARYWELNGPEQADAMIAYLHHGNGDADAAGLVARMAGALAPGARVTILLHAPGLDEDHDWVERQLRAGLAMQGMLDGLRVDTLGARGADIAYMARIRRAAHAVRTRQITRVPGALARAGWAVTKRATADKDAPAERLWAASITGTLRPPPQ